MTASPEPRTRTVSAVDGLRLCVTDFAVQSLESGAAVLFVHGAFGHARVWDFVAGALPQGFGASALDLPGHGDSGRSDAARYAFPALIEDVDAVVRQLPGAPVLVGHSIGGALSALYAAQYPERVSALVVLDIDPHPPASQIEHLNAVGARPPRTWSSWDEVEARIARSAPEADEAVQRHLAAHSYRAIDGGIVERFDPVFLRDLERWDVRAALRRVPAPALVLRGSESAVMTDRGEADFREGLPDLEVRFIEGGTHQLHLDRPVEVAAAIAEFAARRLGAGGPFSV